LAENPWTSLGENTWTIIALKLKIRPLALGRKNWLFADSERGTRAAALFLGLVHSCKACQVNPWEYFDDDVLRCIMNHPIRHLRQLLPDQW